MAIMINKVKSVFKNYNILCIISVLHQDHMFLIKDISTFLTLFVLLLRDNAKDDFFDLPQHIPALIMTLSYEIFYAQQPDCKYSYTKQTKPPIPWCWYHSQFRGPRACAGCWGGTEYLYKRKTTWVWLRLPAGAQPVPALGNGHHGGKFKPQPTPLVSGQAGSCRPGSSPWLVATEPAAAAAPLRIPLCHQHLECRSWSAQHSPRRCTWETQALRGRSSKKTTALVSEQFPWEMAWLETKTVSFPWLH